MNQPFHSGLWLLVATGLLCPPMMVASLAEPISPPFQSSVDADRAIVGHVSQEDIVSEKWNLRSLRLAGERLFLARFTRKDGVGRPASTGRRFPTARLPRAGTEFSRA